MLVWVLLAGYLVICRFPFKWIALTVLLAAISISLQRVEGVDTMDRLGRFRLADLWSYIEFAILFLGHPIRNLLDSGIPSDVAAGSVTLLILSGAAVITALLVAVLRGWAIWLGRAEEDSRAGLDFYVLVLLFGLGIALSTAIARYPYFGLTSAFSNRYLIGAVLFWCALIGFFSIRSQAFSGVARVALNVILAVGLAALIYSHPREWKELVRWSYRTQVNNIATVMRLDDDQFGVARFYHGLADKVYRHYETDDKSIYRSGWPRWIGMKTSRVFAGRENTRCEGGVIDSRQLRSGAPGRYLEGWGREAATGSALDGVLFVDGSGTIVGAGLPLGHRARLSATLGSGYRPVVWGGYHRLGSSAPPAVYGVIGARVCRLPGIAAESAARSNSQRPWSQIAGDRARIFG